MGTPNPSDVTLEVTRKLESIHRGEAAAVRAYGIVTASAAVALLVLAFLAYSSLTGDAPAPSSLVTQIVSNASIGLSVIAAALIVCFSTVRREGHAVDARLSEKLARVSQDVQESREAVRRVRERLAREAVEPAQPDPGESIPLAVLPTGSLREQSEESPGSDFSAVIENVERVLASLEGKAWARQASRVPPDDDAAELARALSAYFDSAAHRAQRVVEANQPEASR